MATIRPPRKAPSAHNDPVGKKRVRESHLPHLISNGPVNLDQERPSLGLQQCNHQQEAHLPPTLWCIDGTSATHASIAVLSRPEAHLLPTSTYPRSASCWYAYLHDGPSQPSSRSWQLGPSKLMSAWDVHGSHKDTQ